MKLHTLLIFGLVALIVLLVPKPVAVDQTVGGPRWGKGEMGQIMPGPGM